MRLTPRQREVLEMMAAKVCRVLCLIGIHRLTFRHYATEYTLESFALCDRCSHAEFFVAGVGWLTLHQEAAETLRAAIANMRRNADG